MPYYARKYKLQKHSRSSLSSLIKKLDKEFSMFIRLRDAMPNGVFRCISCGQIKPIEQADAGHYYSRTHMSTRFDEDNVHAECRFCNRFKADHMIGYRENLIKKIGERRFSLLALHANQSKKWSVFELEELIKHYKKKIEELKKS